jgi:hypothetical protein
MPAPSCRAMPVTIAMTSGSARGDAVAVTVASESSASQPSTPTSHIPRSRAAAAAPRGWPGPASAAGAAPMKPGDPSGSRPAAEAAASAPRVALASARRQHLDEGSLRGVHPMSG